MNREEGSMEERRAAISVRVKAEQKVKEDELLKKIRTARVEKVIVTDSQGQWKVYNRIGNLK
ncbi:MAG TPA: hypothetical protein VIT44_17750 [Cyclobacteriaceae bacterium]